MSTTKKGLVLILILLLTLFLTTAVLKAAYHDGGYFGTDYDFDGETINFWAWGDPHFQRFEEGEIAEGRIEEAEEIFNVNIELKLGHWADIGETYADRLLAGDSKYDVWRTQNILGYYELLALGGLYPISDIVLEEYFEKLNPERRYSIETMSYEGNKYGFWGNYGHHDVDFVMTGKYVLHYNREIIEESGVKDPFDLYVEGDWTWDNFVEMSRELTMDTTGDGEIDQWAKERQPWLVENWLFANDGEVIAEKDGEFVFAVDSPENEEMLRLLREFHTVEELSGGDFEGGTAAFYPQRIGLLGEHNELFDAGFVPFPKGPNADEHIFSIHALTTWVLPINSVYPEAKMALHEFLFWDDPEILEEEHQLELREIFPEEKYAEIAIELTQKWDGTGFYIRPGDIDDIIQHDTLNPVINDAIGFRAAVDEMGPEVQATLDDFFEQ